MIIGALLLLYVLWQAAELRLFRVTEYKIPSKKVKGEIRTVVLSDLHGFSYGKGNERLICSVKEQHPDLILIAGDLVTTKHERDYRVAADLLYRLKEIAPVFYAYGNHELFAEVKDPRFQILLDAIRDSGTVLLNNAFSTESVRGDEIRIQGLSLPTPFFDERKEPPLSLRELKEYLGPSDPSVFSVLLAHDPVYADQYFAYGADLTLSGHNHGGLICLPGGRSLITPRFHFFPKYGAGHFEKDQKHLIVSRGLGTHKYHIRIFNRAELLSVRILPG